MKVVDTSLNLGGLSRLVPLLLVLGLLGCSRLPLSSGEKIDRAFGVRPLPVLPELSLFNPIWSKNLDPEYNTGNLPIGVNEPLIHGAVVYAGDQRGFMRAYELETGRELWAKFDDSTYHSSPVAYQDQIIYGTVQGRVVSRHQSTGELKYEIDLGASVESPGAIADGRVLFHLRNHQIFCLDVETGKILWAYRRSVPHQTTLQGASKPLIHDNKVIVGFADGYVGSFSLEDGLLLWDVRLSPSQKFVDADTNPVIFMNQLYMGAEGSGYTLVDPETGQILYQLPYQVSVEAKIWNNQLILGTADGQVVLLSRDLRELRTQEVEGQVTSLGLWGEFLMVSTTRGFLYALNRDTFEVVEKKHLGHAHSSVFGRMQIEGRYLVIQSARNRLYSYALRPLITRR